MTSEKKPRSKQGDRQRTARQPTAPEAPTIEPVAERQPEAPLWHEQAAFHVTLDRLSDAAGVLSWQTHAYHEESGDEYMQPDVLDNSVIGWMRERAGLPAEVLIAPAPEALAAPPAAAPLPAIGLSVGALEVIELPAERQAGGAEIGAQVCAQVTFELTGTQAYLATADLRPYAIQVVALDLDSAKSVLLGSLRRDLQPELLTYSATLELDLPPIGRYQLTANVVLPDDDMAAVLAGPVLNVVP